MSMTISVRADESLLKLLEERASASHKTVSELVREILEEALASRPVSAQAGHLRGRLQLSRASSERWRRELRQRNWRS